jgi:short-subunit dehydrogenase
MATIFSSRPLAAITGASSGIGFELAKCCAEHGFDLLVTADEPAIYDAAAALRAKGATVDALEMDLSTRGGVEEFYAASGGRPIEVLLANAGRGLGHAFLDQSFEDIRRVVDTNITGTLYLLHQVAFDMRARRRGRILITGSIIGLTPGTFQAVYGGTKAFLDQFSLALRRELEPSGITVTCLMPGATDTEFFERADMLDARISRAEKDDPAEVARAGFEAMMHGEAEVVAGWRNKLRAAIASVAPHRVLAEAHRRVAKPGSADRH